MPKRIRKRARDWWLIEPLTEYRLRTFCNRPEGAHEWVIQHPAVSCEVVRVREVLPKRKRKKSKP